MIARPEWVEQIRATLPELPWVRRARIQQEWQLPEKEFRDLVNAGALDLIVETVEAGTTADEARAWWVSYINGKANELGEDLDAVGVRPEDVARVVQLVKEGKLTTCLLYTSPSPRDGLLSRMPSSA